MIRQLHLLFGFGSGAVHPRFGEGINIISTLISPSTDLSLPHFRIQVFSLPTSSSSAVSALSKAFLAGIAKSVSNVRAYSNPAKTATKDA